MEPAKKPVTEKKGGGSKIDIKLWLVRHGETFANLQRIIQGQQGGELTKTGV